MAISKTGGIQLSTEIDKELSLGKSISAYRDTFFLHSPSNTARIIPGDKAISFSQLDGCTKLNENTPLTPIIRLLKQSTLVTNNSVSQTGTRALTVTWLSSDDQNDQPVLAYGVAQNNPEPTTKWYETTGGTFTDVTTSLNASNKIDFLNASQGYRVSSQINIPLDATGTRTFVAVGQAFTTRTDEGTVVATNTEQFPAYTVNRTVGAAPTARLDYKLLNRTPVKKQIVTYTDGTATVNPSVGVGLYFKVEDEPGAEFGEPGLSERGLFDLPYSRNGYVATGEPYWEYAVFRSLNNEAETDVTSEFKVEVKYEGYKRTSLRWNRLFKNFTYTSNGNYKYRAVISRKRAYTNPLGNAETITVSLPAFTQEVVISTKSIENRKPTLLGLVIDQDEVYENPNRAAFKPTDNMRLTATIQTQHAIGEHVKITDTNGIGGPQLLPAGLSKLLISSNEQTIELGRGTGGSYIANSKKIDDRTLTLTVTPYDDSVWESTDSVSDDVIIKNNDPFGPRLLTKEVDVSSVDEGGSFTYTLEGQDFAQTNYTWNTTFPAEAVSATSGSFTTPYTGSLFKGRYSGSFTVDTVVRSTHYRDVIEGRINVFRDGELYVQTAADLKIKNTHAEPVTLPTKTADPSHHVHAKAGSKNGAPYQDTLYCIVALRSDGTYTVNNDVFETKFLDYATPQPLEGGWTPRIKSAGEVKQEISKEDLNYYYLVPSGGAKTTANFSNVTGSASAVLKMTTLKLLSSIAEAECVFEWEFYNTASKATRPGGTITTKITANTIPKNLTTIYVEPEGGIYGYGPTYSEPTPIFITDVDVYEAGTNQTITVVEDGESRVDVHPTRGTLIDTYCVGTTEFGKYANGSGGTYNALIKANSKACGYVTPKKTTGTAPVNPEYANYDVKAIQKAIDEIGVIDLSDILGSISLNIGM